MTNAKARVDKEKMEMRADRVLDRDSNGFQKGLCAFAVSKGLEDALRKRGRVSCVNVNVRIEPFPGTCQAEDGRIWLLTHMVANQVSGSRGI